MVTLNEGSGISEVKKRRRVDTVCARAGLFPAPNSRNKGAPWGSFQTHWAVIPRSTTASRSLVLFVSREREKSWFQTLICEQETCFHAVRGKDGNYGGGPQGHVRWMVPVCLELTLLGSLPRTEIQTQWWLRGEVTGCYLSQHPCPAGSLKPAHL